MLALAACINPSTINYLKDEYQGVSIKEIAMPEDTYRIFDRPDHNKLMITPSLGAAMAQGFGEGLTLNSADLNAPRPVFEHASLKYLTDSGRPNCKITDAYMLVKPQWEVKYDCAPPFTVSAPPAPKRQAR